MSHRPQLMGQVSECRSELPSLSYRRRNCCDSKVELQDCRLRLSESSMSHRPQLMGEISKCRLELASLSYCRRNCCNLKGEPFLLREVSARVVILSAKLKIEHPSATSVAAKKKVVLM